MKRYGALLVIIVVLIIDQALKIYIKTHWMLGQELRIADWFILHFTENNGMAYGMELGGSWGKLALSLFRLFAISFIGYYLCKISKDQKMPTGYIVAVALVFAGALGNIIDSAFYGLVFNDSYNQVAQFMPEAGGYADFLYGKVVDMFYFPILDTHLPDWFPFWPNKHFIFFRPIFNVADSAITTGIFIVLIFYRQILLKN